jgi:creatinine amidohydrolase
MSQWLQELTWQEVADYLQTDNRIIIPVGSTEQHGKCAPLGTDTYVATALAESAARAEKVLIAPPVWTGWSPHHLVQPGTISVRAEVLIELLSDIFTSLAAHNFSNFVVINGHRIVNISWMQIAAERAQRELGVQVALFDPAHMSKEFTGFDCAIGHAEPIEISHMLHFRPELVHLERSVDCPSHSEKTHYHIDPKDQRDSLCYVPATLTDMRKIMARHGDTINGSPSQSDPETGQAYHEHLVNRLISVLKDMAS